MKENKLTILQTLLFDMKKSSPEGLLFLQKTYGVDFATDKYPELTAISLHRTYGNRFDRDLTYAIGGLREKQIKGFDFGSSEDWAKLVDDVGGVLEWGQNVLDSAIGVTTVLDAALTSEEEKEKAAAALEAAAKSEQEENEKNAAKNKQLLYTAIGVIAFLTVLIVIVKKHK